MGASCAPRYIRKHAYVVDERNGYIEFFEAKLTGGLPSPLYKAAHYIHKGVHLLALAKYDMTSARRLGSRSKSTIGRVILSLM